MITGSPKFETFRDLAVPNVNAISFDVSGYLPSAIVTHPRSKAFSSANPRYRYLLPSSSCLSIV